MKKILFITFISLAFFDVAKAQTSSLHQSAVDTIKTLTDFAKYLKAHPVESRVSASRIDSPVFTYKGMRKNPVVTGNKLNFRVTETIAENMPVAKKSSADHMPIAKLGDTETTHFTMLIKPIPSNDVKNPMP